MRIQKGEFLAGLPILNIRNFLRKVEERDSFNSFSVQEYFHLSPKEAISLLQQLEQEGLVEGQGNIYHLTVKGRSLANARCVKPLNREKADQIFREFMQRVEEVNQDDFYLYRVSKLLLFGSYLKADQPDYGDIDIAFQLERKIEDFDEFTRLNENLAYEAAAKGKHFSGFMDQLYYSYHLVLLKLKNKNPYISLHPIMEDGILESVETKQIYPVEK